MGALGCPLLVFDVYLVAKTNLYLSDEINSPIYFSFVPSVYLLAVSIKLPPASIYSLKLGSSLDAPHPQSFPNVIAPRQISETRNPLFPADNTSSTITLNNTIYFIVIHTITAKGVNISVPLVVSLP